MELLQLRYFLTVARLGSITKAAAEHHIPQPAMSQTIQRLENELGTQLFDRENKRIYLNDNGAQFLACVKTAIQAIDNGVQMMKKEENNPTGSIHLLVRESRRFIFECVSKFSKVYPNITFSITHDANSSQSTQYDLCVLATPFYQHMHGNVPLIRERIVLAAHQDNPIAARKSVRLNELRHERFISMSNRSSMYAITLNNCRECGFEPNVSFICDDPYFVRKYISEDMGIALVPSISWAGRFRENTRLIPIEEPNIVSTSYLVWDAKRYEAQAIRLFREYLIAEAKKIEGNIINQL